MLDSSSLIDRLIQALPLLALSSLIFLVLSLVLLLIYKLLIKTKLSIPKLYLLFLLGYILPQIIVPSLPIGSLVTFVGMAVAPIIYDWFRNWAQTEASI